jgi:hypothetical protein
MLGWGQGVYFLLTGVWPLVHMPSFLWVTGDKTDLWLVETVSVLVIAMGVGLLTASYAPLPQAPVGWMAITAAAGLAIIEIVHVTRGTILPIYLADAVVEVGFITWWGILWWRNGRQWQ